MVAVPDVSGMTEGGAGTSLNDARLMKGIVTYVESDAVAAGKVMSQDPIGGATAAMGSPVDLVVSQGNGGLVGHWRMDDNASNPTVVDSSGYGNYGTAQRNTQDMHTTGMVDGALIFNGSSDYIDLRDISLPSGNSPRSVCFWINAAASTNSYYIFYYGKASVNNRFSIYRDGSDGKLKVSAYANDWDTGHVLSTGVWKHVAFTFDGGAIKLYIDGSFAASTTKTYDTVLDKAYIGCHEAMVAFFEGVLDDFAIFDKALSVQEIEALYNEGVEI